MRKLMDLRRENASRMLQVRLVERKREGHRFVHAVKRADPRFRDSNGRCVEHEDVIEDNDQLGIVKTSRARQTDTAADRDRGHPEIAVREHSTSDVEIVAERSGLERNTSEGVSRGQLR